MKAAAFDYVRPQNLADAIGLLSNAGCDAQVMAGGQSLVPMMNLRLASPELVIDIGRLHELRATADAPDHVLLGACVTHAAIEDGAVPDPAHGFLAHVAANLAYRAVRTRGTLGGSLALADPAADWLAVMVALDAQIILQGPRGPRWVPAKGFATGVYETVKAQGEIIESIHIPRLTAHARWGYSKFCRKMGEFANSIAAVVRDPARDYARAVIGAVNGPPIILERTSARVLGGEIDGGEQAIAEDLNDRAFDDFQSALHKAMAIRAVRQVLS